MDGLYEDLRAEERRQIGRPSPRVERLLNVEKLDWEAKFPPKQKTLRGRTIQKLVLCNGTLVIAVNPCSILRWKLTGRDSDEVDIPCKADDFVEQLFLDPSANHLLIGMKSGDVYYLHSKANKPKKLSKFQGNLESVAFDPNQTSDASTKSFLAGTSTGLIYEIALDASGKEKTFQVVYQLEEPIAVTAIHFETFSDAEFRLSTNTTANTAANPIDLRHLILFATTTPTRFYHVVGGATLQGVFAEAKEKGELPFSEIPGDLHRAELRAYPLGSPLRSKNFALMTGAGIYYGPMAAFASSGSEANMEAHIMPFPQTMRNDQPFMPLSFSSTEFHFLVLSEDTIQVVSSLNGDLIEEERLYASDGQPLGIASDVVRVSNLMYTANCIFQVALVNEDRNVWKTFLDKAVASGEDSVFDLATLYAKTPDQKRLVHRTRAEFYYTAGALDKAAGYFAKSGLQFEDVTMRLLVDWKSRWQSQVSQLAPPSGSSGGTTNAGNASPCPPSTSQTLNATSSSSSSSSSSSDALSLFWWKEVDAATPLRLYILEILKSLPMHMKSQKTMLAIWLVEIYLHQIAAAENYETSAVAATSGSGSGPLLRREEITSDFQRFVRDFRSHLDYPTLLSLITARNQRSLLLYVTRIMGDYHRVVSILITGQKYGEALSLLMDAPTEKIELFIYKVAPILMEHEPEKTIEMLLRKSHLSFASLLPMIMHYTTQLDAKLASLKDTKPSTTNNSNKLLRQNSQDDDDVRCVEDNYAIRYIEHSLEKCGLFLHDTSSSSSSDINNNNGNGNSSHPFPNGADDTTGIDLDLWAASTVEPVMIHTFVWLLAKYDPLGHEKKLCLLLSRLVQLRELSFLDDLVTLDAEYILRMCRMFHRRHSAIRALLLLRHRLLAVTEALSVDVSLAKNIARQERDTDMQKKLWLEIALYQIQHDVDIKHAIAVIADSNGVLQIEDLLPLLPDFTEIDLFKTEICSSLQQSSDRIQLVREDMTRLAQSVDHTVQELEAMKNRCYTLSSNYQRCETCHDLLLGKQFYLFPCSHGFHCECLMHQAPQILTPSQYQAFQVLADALKTLTTGRGKEFDHRTRVQVENIQAEMDNYVAADCPLCGGAMIQALSLPLVDEQASNEAKSWELN